MLYAVTLSIQILQMRGMAATHVWVLMLHMGNATSSRLLVPSIHAHCLPCTLHIPLTSEAWPHTSLSHRLEAAVAAVDLPGAPPARHAAEPRDAVGARAPPLLLPHLLCVACIVLDRW